MASASPPATARAASRATRPEMTDAQKQCLLAAARALVRDLAHGQPAGLRRSGARRPGRPCSSPGHSSASSAASICVPAAACWASRCRCGPPCRSGGAHGLGRCALPAGVAERGRTSAHGSLAAAQSRAGAVPRAGARRRGHDRQARRPGHPRHSSTACSCRAWPSRTSGTAGASSIRSASRPGLHPTAWQDEATALLRLRGRGATQPAWPTTPAPAALHLAAPRCARPDDLHTYVDFCCDNIGAILQRRDAEPLLSWASPTATSTA